MQRGLLIVDSTTADHGQMPRSTLEQVGGGHTRSLHVIAGHMVAYAPHVTCADRDHRIVHVQILRGQALILRHGQDQSVGHGDVEIAKQFSRPLRVLPTIGDDVHQVVVRPRLFDNAIGEFRQVRRRQHRHGKRDDAGAVAVQIARRHVDPVSEPADDLLHACPGLIGHAAGIVDDIGGGFQRNAGFLRHITQGDAFPAGFDLVQHRLRS